MNTLTNKVQETVNSFYIQLELFCDQIEDDHDLMDRVDHDKKTYEPDLVEALHKTNEENKRHQNKVRTKTGQIDKRLKITEGPDLPAFGESVEFLQNGRFIDLALAMLEVCASDIVKATKILNSDLAPDDMQYKLAFELRNACYRWLFDEPTDEENDQVFVIHDEQGNEVSLKAPGLPYSLCALLLEQELRAISDQETVPEIYENRRVLADWIVSDPEKARYVLSRYSTLLTKDGHTLAFENDKSFAASLQSVSDKGSFDERKTIRQGSHG